jgi:hypothetical protein
MLVVKPSVHCAKGFGSARAVLEEETMKCLFLKGRYMLSCSARREVYVPSIFELGEYCKSTRYKVCPFYCAAQDEGSLFSMSDEIMPFDEIIPKGVNC